MIGTALRCASSGRRPARLGNSSQANGTTMSIAILSRGILVCAATLSILSRPLPAQQEKLDTVGIVRALAAYVRANPMGGGHGPISHIVVDTIGSRWNNRLQIALEAVQPWLWLNAEDATAIYEPHLNLRGAFSVRDTVVADALWTRCFSGGGGESVWPMNYKLVRDGSGWQVTAVGGIVAHGFTCSVRRGS